MLLITIAQARAHCKADAADDPSLTIYADAAEEICARYANRNLYASTAALNAAVDVVDNTVLAAYATYDAAMVAAALLSDTNQRASAEVVAATTLSNALSAQDRVMYGIVADKAVIAAVLLTLGHLYRNRESVVAEDMRELPQGAEAIMNFYRKVGPL